MGTMTHPGTTAVSDHVLEAASELFASEGLYRVGINRIIDEAGVAKATFYRHFPSRDHLVLVYVDGLGRRWAAALKEAAGPFATHPADQLLNMFDALAWDGHPGDDRGAAAFLRASAETRPGTAAHRKITEHKERIQEWIAGLATQSGAGDPEKLARTLEPILEGGQASEVTSPDPEAPNLAREAARHVIRSAISSTAQTASIVRESVLALVPSTSLSRWALSTQDKLDQDIGIPNQLA